MIQAQPPWIRILDAHHKRYQKGYTLAAWDAYLIARRLRKPIPEWVLTYFEKSAESLLQIPKGDTPTKTSTSTHVMSALRLGTSGGKGNAFTRTLNEVIRWRAVRRVLGLHDKHPERDLEIIYMDVAEEMGVSNRTIEEWYNERHEVVGST